MNSYTYIYLDPRQRGRYITPQVCFLYRPFYVGKGTKDRYNWLLENILYGDVYDLNSILFGYVSEIILENIVPFIVSIECKNESHSFEMEYELTHKLGLIVESLEGVLCNMRHGGLGGFQLHEATKQKLRVANLGCNNPNYGKKWTKERHEKVSKTWERRKKNCLNFKQKENMLEIRKILLKQYQITSCSGEIFIIDDLSKWCSKNKYPLTSFRLALKTDDGIVRSISKRRSRVEGWKIEYL